MRQGNERIIVIHPCLLYTSITAKGSFDDMRQGFLSGSDDYMVKPVNVNEMVLRVGALLRRAQILNEHKIVIGSTCLLYTSSISNHNR